MPNLVVKSDGSVVQKTHIARTHDKDQSYELVALPESETKMSLLGNLFLSNGKIFVKPKYRVDGQSCGLSTHTYYFYEIMLFLSN